MEYIEKEFLEPKEIKNYTFKTLKDLSDSQRYELARIFTTVFNADNINVIKELGIEGRTVKEGLWVEELHTVSDSLEVINSYLGNEYLSCVLLEKSNKEDIVIGAMIIQKRDLENMTSRGYEINFEIPAGTEFWCEVDTFKREVSQSGKRISGLTQKMRNEIILRNKKENPVLLYSSTNNPFMVKAWQNDGFEVIEKMTTFGNKFQSFKLIL